LLLSSVTAEVGFLSANEARCSPLSVVVEKRGAAEKRHVQPTLASCFGMKPLAEGACGLFTVWR